MGRLDGKVALITGGARGMGKSHVRHFVAEGARVVFGDVRDDQGQYASGAARAGDDVFSVLFHRAASSAKTVTRSSFGRIALGSS